MSLHIHLHCLLPFAKIIFAAVMLTTHMNFIIKLHNFILLKQTDFNLYYLGRVSLKLLVLQGQRPHLDLQVTVLIRWCASAWHQITWENAFFMVKPNICVPSV